MLVKPAVVLRGKTLRMCQFFCGISHDQHGVLRAELPLMIVPTQMEHQGIGSCLLAAHVQAAQRLGIRQIEGRADSQKHLSRQYNGFYTFPRLGFDGALTQAQRQQLPPAFSQITRVSELMQTPAGRTWWRENGSDLDVIFDATPGSASMSTLQRYFGAAWTSIPTTAPPIKRV